MNSRIYSGAELAATANFIEKLLTTFSQESKPFFVGLNEGERKQLQRYLEYRKAEHQDNWTFSAGTYQTITAINHRAGEYYETCLRYQQLELNLRYQR